jgi:RNA polymerase nonessential primary-like sigma factor
MLEAARMMNRAKQETEEKPEDPDDSQAVEDTAYFQSRQRIQELLSGLEEADANLLILRFGLEGGLPMTPQEAGRRLGLTPDEVIVKEAAALAKLRQK